MTIGIWELVAGGWCLVFAGCAAGWLLGVSSARSRRGGMLDLTPHPADGSLGMDWTDQRQQPREGGGTGAIVVHSMPVETREALDEWDAGRELASLAAR